MLLVNWLKSLKRRVRVSDPTRKSHSRRRTSDQPRALAVEALEQKTLLAAVGYTAGTDVLVFDGDAGDVDDVEVIGDGGANTLTFIVGNADVITLAGDAVANADFVLSTTNTVDDTLTISLAGSPVDDLIINGGDMNDTLDISQENSVVANNVVVNGDAGNDMLIGSSNSDNLFGGAGDDELIGGDGNDLLNGGADNDTITGGLGADVQFGEAGDDEFIWNNGDGPDDNTGGADTDTFTFNGADGPDDVLILSSGIGDGSLVGADFNLERTAPTAFFIEGASIENVNINGLDGDDDITVEPIAGLDVTVDGGTETTSDILRVDAAGANVVVTATGIMVAGFNPIPFTNIEDLDIFNAGQVEVHGDANANTFDVTGLGLPDLVNVVVDGTLSIDLDTPGLTIRGMDGNDVLSVNEDAVDGLPSFTGMATGAHTNAAFGTSGLGPANVGIHFDGGTGNDSAGGNFLTAQDVTYFSDDVSAANSGLVNVGGEYTMSFEGLAPLIFVGAGGTLTLDATATPATTFLTVADAGAAGDGVNEVTGDGGFETTTFSGFDALTVLGGDGAETITLASLDAADPDGGGPGAALTAITLDGDNTASTDMAADLILVEALPATVTAVVTGGGGNDIINIGSPPRSGSSTWCCRWRSRPGHPHRRNGRLAGDRR